MLDHPLEHLIDRRDPTAPAHAEAEATYLGPAEVLARDRTGVTVRLANATRDEVAAVLAFTFPYQPAPGDSLLVLAQGGRHYAVGVLAGSRPTSLEFQGDVDVRAVGGTLTLAGDDGVEVEAPRITLRAGVLRTIAHSVVEKAEQVHRWVKGLLAIRAGTSRRTVDGEDSTRCQDSVTLAKGTVKIDGDQLHLGH
ncbi:MAG TPA: DUF3540 domain-containing protein [Planctomycetota bacterium]|nr:DUF3540 domain-containing protein [Planctomycetota bacterium]